MRKLLERSAAGVALALLSPAALAVQREEVQEFVIKAAALYVPILIVIVTAILVYFTRREDKRSAPVYRLINDFTRWQDKHAAPLHALLDGDATYSVEADALVVECVRKMTDRKIGALVVMNGHKLIGIFTERDALNKVLAAGRDPRSTRVFEVMTKDPYCVSPETTVAEAMELVTKRHFRHLPVVDNGTVHAVLSSRDLMHWLAKDQMGEVHNLLELAA